MADQMVLQTQQWLNDTYRNSTGFGSVVEDGRTGWDTIYGLIRGLQIELGITALANSFGPSTQAKFRTRWPDGIPEQDAGAESVSNVYAIIQGALWCKGYSTGSDITTHFYAGTGNAIKRLKTDMGISGNSTVTLDIMRALLSMQQFVLLQSSGGTAAIRSAQMLINQQYRDYTAIIPTDGLYGRDMNTALIQVLQSIEGFTPAESTGHFGDGTKARLKTITASNASTYSEWVRLASIALICNRVSHDLHISWNTDFADSIIYFQNTYQLPKSGSIDSTTWMSLLISRGDPDRPCVACDTRFEITGERLEVLKANGYQIVGRYLTEPDQESKEPEQYFKAIRPGELERITSGGVQFFPIFQENSRLLSDFTSPNGARHAQEARIAAQRLGIPPTVVYFAVDFDATDPQVTSHILPYFQAINSGLGGGYKVGIYASRNICSRIITAGFASSAFVSDMSTGFSGNLGFPIPQAWNYDQFTEISNFQGNGFDLDRVAYSQRVPPVNYVSVVTAGDEEVDLGTNYPKLSPIDLVWHLEERFEELRGQGKVGKDYIADPSGGTGTWSSVPTWQCILNYLAKDYLRDGGSGSAVNWALSAESFRSTDANLLENDPVASKVIKALDRYISGRRQSMVDKSGESVDLSHLSATTLGYTNWNVIPDAWTGWAGDLATAMGNMQKVIDWNPEADLQQVSAALVGMGDDYRSHPGLVGLTLDKINADGLWESVKNNCNRDDLCCDGDAVFLADILNTGHADNVHLLSQTLRTYYNSTSQLANRFKQIAWSMEAGTGALAYDHFYEAVTVEEAPLRRKLAGYVSDDVIRNTCRALASFIF